MRRVPVGLEPDFLPEGNERALLLDVKLIDGTLRHLKSAIVFFARGVEIAHERAGIAEALLRGEKSRIDAQRLRVVLERRGVVAGDARDFAE